MELRIIKNKRGMAFWQIIAAVLTVVIIALVIYGIFSGKLTPLFKQVMNKIYSVLSLFGYGDSSAVAPIKTATILGKERNVSFNEGDGTNFACITDVDNINYKVQFDTSKKDYVLWEKLGNEWKNVDEQKFSNEDLKNGIIYYTLLNTLNSLTLEFNNKKYNIKHNQFYYNDYFFSVEIDGKVYGYFKLSSGDVILYTCDASSCGSDGRCQPCERPKIEDLKKEGGKRLEIYNSFYNAFANTEVDVNGKEYGLLTDNVLDNIDGHSRQIIYVRTDEGKEYGLTPEGHFLIHNKGESWKNQVESTFTGRAEPAYMQASLDQLKAYPNRAQIKQELVETCDNW
ncbi:hypothetical protein FJZ19_05725 [Candidatus Pacearchaeota archaeon]|nr:hypothetical protein [Candidatus Pacearchaeota archaeon]